MGRDAFGLFRGWCKKDPRCLEYCAAGEPNDPVDVGPLRCTRCRCLPQEHVPAVEEGYDPNSEAQLAELNEEHHEVLHQLRERENRLDSLEAEAVGLRRTSDEMREENAALTQSKHALETAASAREVELCALKQSLRDKEELNEKVGSLLDAANEAKQQQLENLGFVKEANEQLQAKLKAAGEEAVKGSELVNKLQAEAKALRAKLKQTSATLSQQEELAAQKQTEIEEAERTVSELRAQLAEESGVKEGAIESGAETKRQLVEAQELIRSNQQIIQWLNKELNDSQKTAPRLHGAAEALPGTRRAGAGTDVARGARDAPAADRRRQPPAGAPAEGLGRPDAGVRHDIDAGAAGTRLSQEREESAAAEECGLMLSM